MSVPAAIESPHTTTTHLGVALFASSVPLAMSASVMTPMVFCASLVPCAIESNDVEPIWPTRMPRDLVSLSVLLVSLRARVVAMAAMTKAMIGAATAGARTFPTMPLQSTARPPAWAIIAPMTPPMSA